MTGRGLDKATFILPGLRQPLLCPSRPFFCLSALLSVHRGSVRHTLSTSPTQFPSP